MVSKSGRDNGKFFVIIKVVNDRFVLIADGDLRKVENPKMKNVRHLQMTNLIAEDVVQYLNRGEIPGNHIVRKNIKRILETRD